MSVLPEAWERTPLESEVARRENMYHYYELDRDGIRQVAEPLFAESLLP